MNFIQLFIKKTVALKNFQAKQITIFFMHKNILFIKSTKKKIVNPINNELKKKKWC